MFDMRRREFIAALGGAAASWPTAAARAQQPPMPVIGFLSGRSLEDSAGVVEAFRQGVQESGIVSGKNITFEYRWANGDFGRLPALAGELVRRPVDVLATAGGTASALAAKAATNTIPIVFLTGDDPVRAGLVGSLNRPGGNLTGVTLSGTVLAAKRLELLRELVAPISLTAVLVNPKSPIAETQSTDVRAAARTLGLKLSFITSSSDADLEPAFATMVKQRAGALFVPQDAFYLSRRIRIAALAAQHAIPAIYESRDFAEIGGLMSYGTNLASMYRQIGIYAGRILRGTKPADLPVMQPTKFELVINLKTAKALGFNVPDKLLALADEVIE
jgi:putative ABC transport system substrate-binding protein